MAKHEGDAKGFKKGWEDGEMVGYEKGVKDGERVGYDKAETRQRTA